MNSNNILEHSQILDESGNIRRKFVPRGDSGFVPHGRYAVLREDGRPLLEITYHQGVVHGPYVDFWSNGKTASEGQFQDGVQEGTWHYYNADGTLREIIQFKDGKEIQPSVA